MPSSSLSSWGRSCLLLLRDLAPLLVTAIRVLSLPAVRSCSGASNQCHHQRCHPASSQGPHCSHRWLGMRKPMEGGRSPVPRHCGHVMRPVPMQPGHHCGPSPLGSSSFSTWLTRPTPPHSKQNMRPSPVHLWECVEVASPAVRDASPASRAGAAAAANAGACDGHMNTHTLHGLAGCCRAVGSFPRLVCTHTGL